MIGVRLRSYRLTDVDPIVAWAGDPDTTRWMGPRWREGRSREQLAEAVERIVAGRAYGSFFVIADPETEAYLGAVDLTSVDPEGRSAVVSLVVAPGHRGRGLGTLALGQLAAYAAGTLGLATLRLRVDPENEAALRCYQKAGFRETGWDEGLRTMERALASSTTPAATSSKSPN